MTVRSMRSAAGLLTCCLALGWGAMGCGDDDATGNDNNNQNNDNPPTYCESSCEGVVAAACADGPSDQTECEQGCAATEIACPTEFDAVLQCAGDSATFQCNGDGRPEPVGCETEQSALYDCLDGVPPTCEETCPTVVAAGCSNGPSNVGECESGCADVLFQCPVEFAALMECGGTNATYSCGTDDMPFMDGCETEHAALYACMGGVPSSCVQSCQDVVTSGCAMAPPTLDDCYTGCAQTITDCPTEYDALIACGGTDAEYSCGANGMVYVDGCETEHDDVYTCVWDTEVACLHSCPPVLAQDCDMGPPSLDECFTGCASSATDCPVEFDALTVCGGDTPSYSCGTNGMVYTVGCEFEHDDLYSCLWQTPDSCLHSCPEVVDAGCSNGPPSLQECFTGCASSASDCPTEFDALMVCAGYDAAYTCDASGMPLATGCETEHNALYSCLGM